jgi:O-antigen/teichoic acid export membrane protein
VTDDARGPWLVVLGTLTWVTSVRRASLRSLFELPYRLALRMETPTVLTVVAEAAHLLALLAFVSLWDLPGAVAAQGAAALPFALVLAVLSARQIAPRLALDLPRLIALARGALPLVGLLFANTVLARADMLLLEMLRGSREVGIYAAPVRLVEVANLLPALLMTSIYPLLVGAAPHDPVRADRLFRVSLRFLTAAVVPVILAEVFWAKPLVRVLFGPEYGAAAAVLPILAATPLLAFTDIVLNSYLLATGREKRNALLVAVAAAVNVALNLVLIPAHGAVGAAWATLLAWGVRIAVTFAPRDTRPAAVGAVRSILPATAAGALAALLVAWTGVHGVAAGVLGALVYAGALLPLRGLRADELQEILRALRRGGP